ncbi:uncharacterized protein METZ01_LOCUS305114 [marine metagenome]|uniref:Uncharacterized protein n=1 Tax=marine metagenome TaxID=408172 RepID=A0A382MUN3_9ZZZZ
MPGEQSLFGIPPNYHGGGKFVGALVLA